MIYVNIRHHVCHVGNHYSSGGTDHEKKKKHKKKHGIYSVSVALKKTNCYLVQSSEAPED